MDSHRIIPKEAINDFMAMMIKEVSNGNFQFNIWQNYQYWGGQESVTSTD